jgi:outer membrane protein assembly factor BamE (lipoprotein component of BamABCDE complex)
LDRKAFGLLSIPQDLDDRTRMKKAFFTLLFAALLSGCATASFETGRRFDASKVSSIQKGQTTKAEILAWFGEPYSKTVSGEDGEMWIYLHSQGTSKAKSMVFTVDVKTEGTSQKLDLIFRGEKVVNFTYSGGPMPGT